MAILTANEIIEVKLRQFLYNHTLLNVLHYRVTTPDTSGTYAQVLGEVADLMYSGAAYSVGSKMLAAQSDQLTHLYCYAQPIYPVRRTFIVRTINTPGALAGAAGTGNVTASIEKKTLLAGRRYVGKIQVGGFKRSEQTDGEWSAAVITDLNLIGAAMLTPVTSAARGFVLQPILYHRGFTPVYTDLSDWFTHATVRVMRRRTLFVGQ